MAYDVTLIPGDGIGPEVAQAARKVLDATGIAFNWHEYPAGETAIQQYGTPLPEETLESIRRDGIALKGPIATPIGKGFRSVNVELRKRLDLYANFRPARSIRGIKTRYENVDIIVIRENTEGLYSGLEHEVVPGVVESQRIITEKGSRRIVEVAFRVARKYRRKKVTAVHKANILKMSDGLFLEVAREIAQQYPDIDYEEAIVDATAMKLVLDPSQFDVLVMENLFGDIISDLTSGLIGGLGVAPSANVGDHYAVFEAVHGSAPDIAGKGIANPTALILSGALMLRHLDEEEAEARIYRAVNEVIGEGKTVTPDLGGTATTEAFVEAIIEAL
ncbi:MAG: isocitrate dehydrogenase (NAD(+)) [Calditrichaeota bacterium]|nr:MAG: isocitrate dehydrogenase (NAD(+)) [Calditrichota bacterium]